ncbi:MAG TPA: PilT/PilU family type 4a pilus ATPase [Candidatus Polarisedimenticolaceae bacterium]|nr:PilT/PilU family type 4a pilus ATPase [Candidatus Polarisedimenticolaceae bacterium]
MTIDDLLRFMVKQEASDLHLKPMRPPLLRIKGKLLPLKTDALHPDLLKEMIGSLLNDRMKGQIEENCAADFGHSVPGVSRFRASVFLQRGTYSAVFRRVPFEFPSMDDWGLPPILTEFTKLNQGLVLITGPTGSGKSSTLASLMRIIVNTRLIHLITIEDPIEFLFKDNLGAVTQREVGTDTPSFSAALRNALRQDPDVIMVGEMRDLPTIQTVLTAAETGHLVFSTVHTNSAVQTIDRIIDQFPESNHRQIRQQLSNVLQAIVSLKLVEKTDGSGLIAAVEILRTSPRVQKLILEGNLDALEEEIENSVSYYKMQSMNQSLASLVLRGAVARDTALAISIKPGDLDLMLRKFLYAAENRSPEEGHDMAEPLSDFSKILELQEIKRLYDELQDKFRQEIGERDEEIARLRSEVSHAQPVAAVGSEADHLRAENERLGKQIQLVRQEYEAKVERMNARLRELSSTGAQAPAGGSPEPGKGGFFRR